MTWFFFSVRKLDFTQRLQEGGKKQRNTDKTNGKKSNKTKRRKKSNKDTENKLASPQPATTNIEEFAPARSRSGEVQTKMKY